MNQYPNFIKYDVIPQYLNEEQYILTMKGGDAYKTLLYRQKICSDVSPLGFQVGGAR